MATTCRNASRSRGFTYLGVLFIISLLGMTAAAASVVWTAAQQRDNEVELVFVGRQFEVAIERYRAASRPPAADPSGDPSAGSSVSPLANPAALYPPSLEALLRDDRAITPQHHLRRIYLDPMTGNAQWGLIRLPGGGIVGVHSLSDRQPFPRKFVVAGFSPPRSQSYRDWRFIAPSAEELLATPQQHLTRPGITAPAASPDAAPLSPGTDGAPPSDADQSAAPTRRALPRLTLQDLRSQTPEACDRIAAYDAAVCADQAERYGDEAAQVCLESATARTVACAVGDKTPLSPLVTR